MKQFARILITFTLLCMAAEFSLANNISVSSVIITGQNTTAGVNNSNNYTLIRFSLSWENSWRISSGASNWDAAWVFVKYRVGTGNWQHAYLNNTGNSAGTGTAASVQVGLKNEGSSFNAISNPATGAFFYRSGSGSGSFGVTTAQLRWNYGANGINDNDTIDIRVFAVEMVYVPTGSFYAGDGTSTNVAAQFRNGSTNTALQITSESALTLGGTSNGNLANNNATGMSPADDYNNTTTQTLPAAYPKGYTGFYCMKYEASQQQYVDFFNTLTNTQKANRDLTDANHKNSDATVTRNYISWSSGDATLNSGSTGDIACNHIRWMDAAAYMDWSCMRPMTELEFEKACRGNQTVVANEYAWGTTSITPLTSVSNAGLASEASATSNANANYGANYGGPLRVGIFAGTSNLRESAGATYYGIMEMSGNLWEFAANTGASLGRAYTGALGDGVLASSGNADVANWPGISSGEVSTVTGSCIRGASHNEATTYLRVSDRVDGNYSPSTGVANVGFRAVRALPTSTAE